MNWQKTIRSLELQVVDRDNTTRESVSSIEMQLNCTPPPDYVDFLLAVRGAAVWLNSPEFDAEGERSAVEVSFGAQGSSHNSLASNIDTYRRRVPATLLPIARDGGDNLICLGIRAPDVGKVYFWDHDNERDGDLSYRDNVHKIADSFTEFMDKITPREYGA